MTYINFYFGEMFFQANLRKKFLASSKQNYYDYKKSSKNLNTYLKHFKFSAWYNLKIALFWQFFHSVLITTNQSIINQTICVLVNVLDLIIIIEPLILNYTKWLDYNNKVENINQTIRGNNINKPAMINSI